MRSKGKDRRLVVRRGVVGAALIGVAGVQGTAFAGALELGGGLDAKYNLTLGYAAAMRTEAPTAP